MELNLKTGGLDDSLTPSTRLLNQKLGTSPEPRQLTSSEIDLLRSGKAEILRDIFMKSLSDPVKSANPFENIQKLSEIIVSKIDKESACLSSVKLLMRSIEDGRSISFLMKNKYQNSALTLLRPQVEKLVRGCYLIEKMKDDNFEFDEKTFPPKFEKILVTLEKTSPGVFSAISKIDKTFWGILCDFTHGGKNLIEINADENSSKVLFISSFLLIICCLVLMDFACKEREEKIAFLLYFDKSYKDLMAIIKIGHLN